MQFRKKRYLLLFLSSAMIIFAAIMLYSSSILNEEMLRVAGHNFIRTQLKNAEPEIGQISYRTFPTVSIKISEVKIKNAKKKDAQTELLRINDIEVNFSLMTYFLRKGAIDVKASSMSVFNDRMGKKSNWSGILEAEKKVSLESVDLANWKVNFKTENVDVLSTQNGKHQSVAHMTKLVVKGFNFKTAPAFEAVLNLKYPTPMGMINGQLTIIGDINIEKLVKDQMLDLNIFTVADHFTWQDQFKKLPQFRIRAKLVSSDFYNFEAKTSFEAENFIVGSTTVKMLDDTYRMLDIDVSMAPQNGQIYLGHVLQNILSKYIKDNNFELQVLGDLEWSHAHFAPNLRFKSSNNFNLSLENEIVFKSQFEFSLDKDSIQGTFDSALNSDNVLFSFSYLKDIKQKKKILNTSVASNGLELKPKNIHVLMTFLHDLAVIQYADYKSENYFDRWIAQSLKDINGGQYIVNLEKISLDGDNTKSMSLSAIIKHQKNKDEIKSFMIRSNNGVIELKNNTVIEVNNYSLEELLLLTNSKIGGISGVVDGKVGITYKKMNDVKYSGRFKVKKFVIEALDLTRQIQSELIKNKYAQNIAEQFVWPESFDEFKFRWEITKNKFVINEFLLTGSKSLRFRGKVDHRGVLLDVHTQGQLLTETKKIFNKDNFQLAVEFNDYWFKNNSILKAEIIPSTDNKVR